MRSPEEENTGPVIRDRRRIDPQTGQVRDPGQSGSGQSGPAQPDSSMCRSFRSFIETMPSLTE